jgi:hypothetical protein
MRHRSAGMFALAALLVAAAVTTSRGLAAESNDHATAIDSLHLSGPPDSAVSTEIVPVSLDLPRMVSVRYEPNTAAREADVDTGDLGARATVRAPLQVHAKRITIGFLRDSLQRIPELLAVLYVADTVSAERCNAVGEAIGAILLGDANAARSTHGVARSAAWRRSENRGRIDALGRHRWQT